MVLFGAYIRVPSRSWLSRKTSYYCILVTNICAPYTHTNTLHLTNNKALLVACRGHRHDHFFGAPCAPLGAGIGASGARPQRRRPKNLGYRAADTTCSSKPRTPELPSSRAAAARDGAVLCSTPCFCLVRFSLFVPISASRFRRASARASRSLSGARSRNARISNMLRKSFSFFC